jgi:hypothetical protein
VGRTGVGDRLGVGVGVVLADFCVVVRDWSACIMDPRAAIPTKQTTATPIRMF